MGLDAKKRWRPACMVDNTFADFLSISTSRKGRRERWAGGWVRWRVGGVCVCVGGGGGEVVRGWGDQHRRHTGGHGAVVTNSNCPCP